MVATTKQNVVKNVVFFHNSFLIILKTNTCTDAVFAEYDV